MSDLADGCWMLLPRLKAHLRHRSHLLAEALCPHGEGSGLSSQSYPCTWRKACWHRARLFDRQSDSRTKRQLGAAFEQSAHSFLDDAHSDGHTAGPETGQAGRKTAVISGRQRVWLCVLCQSYCKNRRRFPVTHQTQPGTVGHASSLHRDGKTQSIWTQVFPQETCFLDPDG